MLAIVTVMAIIPIMSLTAFAEPSTPETEQYFITMYWGMSYTEELGYIVDKAPMVYDEARGLYTYTVKNAVLKGDGGISIDAYDSDNNKIGIGLFGHIHSDAYGVSVYATLQPGNGSNSLALDRIDPVAPPEWRNGHVAVIDSNDDSGVGKSDQYIQLSPENGVHTATVENMDACGDRRIYLLIDGVVVDIQYITIPTDGSTVIFTSNGNIVSYTVDTPTPTYVAEVNGTPYESIDDAIDVAVATEGSTLKMLADINDGITINGGKFTLDLNGYNIIGNFFALKILGGDITITDSIGDGEINGTHKDGNGVVVENGTCAIEKVTVIGTWGGISGKSSNITVNSGTVTGGYYGIYASTCDLSINGGDILGYSLGMMMYGSSCIVEDGTVKGGIAAMYVAGHYGYADSSKTGSTCIIEGGVITGGNYCICVEDINYRDDNGNIVLVEGGACTITGGSFNADPSEYVAEGYAATLNSETYMYNVAVYTAPSYVAEVNGTPYESITDAISAAKATEGSTLKLLADVTEGIVIDGGKFTFDLNGFGINSTADTLTVINGDIIITDSSSERTGTIFGKSCGVIVYGGSCTISGGTVSGTLYGVYIQDATCDITGGIITGGTDGVNIISGTCKITGGTISSENYGVFIRNGSCIITGGIINGDYTDVYIYGGSLSVSGGSFNTNPSAEYVAEGYVATYNVTTELYDVVACTPPAITGVTFNSDSDGYDSENNVFYITDETPLIITVTGTNMEMFNEFYHIAFLYNGNGPMVKASAVTATEAKLIVDSSVLDYIIEGLELLGSTTDTTGFGIRSLKKTELTYYTELSIKKGVPPAPDYTVELPSDTENGAVTSDVSSAKAGDTVTLTFTPAEGYELESITVTDKGGKAVELENNSFVMPEGGVNISATFSPVPEMTVHGTDDGATVTDPHGTDNSITTDNGSDAQSSDNTLVIVIAVVIALVAIGGGIAALVVISGKNKKKIKK